MFKQLTQIVRKDTQELIDNRLETDRFVNRLGRFGNMLVHNLHGHHMWEDHQYFPELSRADARFDRGLEMLEGDHVALDGLLDKITITANRAIKLSQLDPGAGSR